MKMHRTVLLASLLATAVSAQDWTLVESSKGISTYEKRIPGMDTIAFRGVSEINHDIGELVAVFLNEGRAKEWVDKLQKLEISPTEEPNVNRVYQLYDMPWPVTDREFMLEQKLVTNDKHTQLLAYYSSVEDDRWPITSTYVRAKTFGTFWNFTSLGDGITAVEIDAQVDPSGGLPTWAANFFQKAWPRTTITLLREAVLKMKLPPCRCFAKSESAKAKVKAGGKAGTCDANKIEC